MNDRMVSRVSETAMLWARLPSPDHGRRNGTRATAVANWPARPTRSVVAIGHDEWATPGRRPITNGGSPCLHPTVTVVSGLEGHAP